MLCRAKLKSLPLKHIQIHQSSTKSRIVRKAPDCKFENDECLPKRCVPPTTVCHTLPKQKCVITVKKPQKQSTETVPEIPTCPLPTAKHEVECVKLPDSSAKGSRNTNSTDIPWYEKMLPNEEKLSPGGKMAYRFLKFNAKALIAGGSVYMTAKCGVWGSSQQTADLYKKSNECVRSMINDNAVKVADVPDSREIVAACQHYWNKGVIFTISSIMILPKTLTKWSKELYKQVADNIAGGESSKS